MGSNAVRILKEALSDYGMVLVLLFLIALFSLLTISKEESSGKEAALEVASKIDQKGPRQNIMIITSTSSDDMEMSAGLQELLIESGHHILKVINGNPPMAAKALAELEETGTRVNIIATTGSIARWSLLETVNSRFKVCEYTLVINPLSKNRSRFLRADNIRNIADRISVIAILAIGMTMVIITAGIDLSVGSLIALSAVLAALFIHQFGGGPDAGFWSLLFCSLVAIGVCGLLGGFSGVLSTTFKITPFITTLAMMMIARGLAYKFSDVTTIPITNEGFAWLGKGRMVGIPVSVMVMASLYLLAYFIMHWTTFGRRIYAIGGNKEAARLSGVPVKKVLIWVYIICGLLAGLGGVITASNLAGGAATYGDYYELYTIAAVVVGGTSLMGGQGKIMGTLIGAFIIAVIQSGMNQVGIESNTQRVVFGVVIIAAIVIDKYKRGEISSRQLMLLTAALLLSGTAIYFFLREIHPESYH